MVEIARFNDLKMELLWEGSLVGRMKLAAKRSMSLTGGATQDLVAQSNETGSDNVTVGSEAVGDSALFALNSSATLSYPPGFSVNFYNIPSGISLNRNEIFLTFYTALLHVAEFPAGSQWNIFESVSPNKILTLIMQDSGSGCSVSQPQLCLTLTPKEGKWFLKKGFANAYLLACLQHDILISALVYVPRYMMEHREFGFKETEFVTKMYGQQACVGTILEGVPTETSS